MDDDRFVYGFDAGNIIDGTVQKDPETGDFILIDEEGVKFNPQAALKTLDGKKIRMTMISFEALDDMEEMYKAAQAALGSES